MMRVPMGVMVDTPSGKLKAMVVDTVEKLELKYKVGNIIQTISQIESKKSWKDTIDTNAIQGGNSIILTYKDNKGNSYEEYIVGYLEKGYNGKANVVINNIDENGKLEITIK